MSTSTRSLSLARKKYTHKDKHRQRRTCAYTYYGKHSVASAIHLLFTFIYSLNDIYVAFFVLVTRNDVTVCMSCLFYVYSSSSAVGIVCAQHTQRTHNAHSHTKRVSESNCLFGGEWSTFMKRFWPTCTHRHHVHSIFSIFSLSIQMK